MESGWQIPHLLVDTKRTFSNMAVNSRRTASGAPNNLVHWVDTAHLGAGDQVEMNRAAIDIGSNSLLLTIIDQSGVVLHDSAEIVGLGVGVDDLSVLYTFVIRFAHTCGHAAENGAVPKTVQCDF